MWTFLRSLFRREGLPDDHPLIRPAPVEAWRTGDVAECIGDDWRRGPERRPRRGSQALVLRVDLGHSGDGELGWALELLGCAGRWDAVGFRRVVPQSIEEEQEAGQMVQF